MRRRGSSSTRDSERAASSSSCSVTTAGHRIAVYGMVVSTQRDARDAVRPHAAALRHRFDGANADRLAVARSQAGGRRAPMFGALGAGRARAVARLGGPLRGLELTIAHHRRRAWRQPLLAPHSPLRLLESRRAARGDDHRAWRLPRPRRDASCCWRARGRTSSPACRTICGCRSRRS